MGVEQGGGSSITLSSGKSYKIDEFCLEPTSFSVLEEKLTKAGIVTEAVPTKVTTRQTYVLTGIEGDLATKDGKLSFIEKDGIDYAPTTVQLPGGERVPFHRRAGSPLQRPCDDIDWLSGSGASVA